jgi:hypothetical protein
MATRPKSTRPPAKLEAFKKGFRHPDVVRTGLTTNDAGEWALLLRVRGGAAVPLAGVRVPFPVVYESDDRGLPVARPAYPAAGE